MEVPPEIQEDFECASVEDHIERCKKCQDYCFEFVHKRIKALTNLKEE